MVQAQFDIPYTMVQNEVMDCMGFEQPIDKLVYIALLRFAFGKGKAYPSVPKLAYMCTSTENTIRSAIKRLDSMDLLKKKPRPKSNKDNDTNIYYLYQLSEELKANSVMNEEAFTAAKQADKERRAAKKKAREAKKVLESIEPTSNFEGGKNEKKPTSNFEGGTSNFEGATSNFEGKEYLLNNKDLNTSVCMYVENPNLAFELFKSKFKPTANTEANLTKLCNEHSPEFVGEAIKRAINSEKPINKPISYIRGALTQWAGAGCKTVEDIAKYEEEYKKQHFGENQPKQPAGKKRGNNGRTEMVPEWLKEKKHLENQQEEAADSDFEEEKRKLEQELKELDQELKAKNNKPKQLTPAEIAQAQYDARQKELAKRLANYDKSVLAN